MTKIRHGVTAGAAVAVAALLGATGCGSSAPVGGASGAAYPVVVLPMPMSVASSDGTGWASVEMGGSAAQHNNFWELFVRPATATTWKLVTPTGAASNGGLAAAATGSQSVAAAVLPSQRLTFSPVATTVDGGAQWSQGAPVTPGLAATPDALAAGPDGKLLALTKAGGVDSAPGVGASWTPLTSAKKLAASPAGRACGLTGLTATGWTAAGTAMVAGICSKPGMAGVFALDGNSWQAVGPALPASLAHGPVEVLALATSGTRTTAILAVGSGSSAGAPGVAPRASTAVLAAAWSGDDGSHWSVSPALRAGHGVARSVSIWPDGTAGIVLAGRGETIGWQATEWQSLPPLPKGTATLAQGSGGQLDALAAHASTLTAWQLPAGARTWTLAQTMHVPIPYGSSG